MANPKTASFITITDLNDSVPLIRGTQAAVTGTWTGVAPFKSLENGQQISYLLPFNGSGNATLNLTLDGGGTTGAVACYYGGTSRLTTHYGAGNIIRLTYIVNNLIAGVNYTGWWADANYVDGNIYDRIRYNRNILAKTAIKASRLIVSDSSGYFHLAAGSVFDVDKPILFASSAIAAGATGTNNYTAYHQLSVTGNFPGATFAAYKTVYLKGAVIGTAFTVDATTPITDQPVNTPDAVYMLLGQSYSTTAITLLPQHEIYRFHAGVLKTIAQIASEAVINAEMAQESADDAWDAVNNISIGGRNLVIRVDELKDQVLDTEGAVSAGVGFSIMSGTIKVEPGKVYAFSKTGSEEPGESYWRYNLLDAEGSLISTLTNSANAFYWVAPDDVFFIQVSYPTDAFPQIEQGNVITGWSPAPEDVSNSLVDLTTAVSKTTSIHYTTSLSKFIVDPDMTVGSIVYETDAQKIWRYEGLGKVAPYSPIWTDITSVMLSQALTIALNTQQTVDGKIATFAQETQPIIVSIKPGDTWINSELLLPNILFYENGVWINKQIEISFIQNSTPKATLVAGETWLNAVGKKIYTYGSGEWNDTSALENYRYIQKTAPVFSTSEEKIDNMDARWMNLTDNTIYTFNGIEWLISDPVVKYTYVQGWTPRARVVSDKWYDIITGEVKVFNGTHWTNDTQTITFFTNVVPRTTVNIGDLWFDISDGNKVYRAEGDESEGITWRSYQDSFISETNNNLSNMLKFITGGSNVFNDIHEPTEDATFGDLWYDGKGWKIYDNEEWTTYDRPYLLDDIRESYLVTYDDDIITQKVESAFEAIWTNTDLPSSYISRSELTQTDSNFRIAIGTMISDGTEDLSLGLTNLTDDYTRTVGTYFDFKSDGLSIKSLSDDPDEANLYIKIDNKEIGFWQGDLEVAYISSNKMYIENAHVLHTLTLGAGGDNEQEGYVDFDTKNQGLSAIWRPHV